MKRSLTRDERERWLLSSPFGTKIAIYLDSKLTAVAEKIEAPPPPSRFSARDPFWFRMDLGSSVNDVRPGNTTGWHRYKDSDGVHVVRYDPVTAEIQAEWDEMLERGRILTKINNATSYTWQRLTTQQLRQIEQILDLNSLQL